MDTNHATDPKWAASFDEARYKPFFAYRGQSRLLAAIWRRAYGEDYPADIEPFGFVTMWDLRAIHTALALKSSDTLLDIGCGKGGPGLWVAQESGAKLIGLDILQEAIDQARLFAARFDLAKAPEFHRGSFSDTGLENESVHAIMSVDAFWMTVDKVAALREMARVLAPGGRCALTTWSPRHLSMGPLFRRNGLELVSEAETPDWRHRQMQVYEDIVAHEWELRRELGNESAGILLAEAKEGPATLDTAPRVLIVAQRK